MADIKLRIEVNPNAETETLGAITNKVNNVGSNANLSNASFKANSDGVYINTSNPKESGREMLSWGENGILKFDSAGNLSSNGVDTGYLASETEPDEFVWGVVPSTKKYSVKLTFSNATSLKDIVVYGDPTAKQFPTKAIIDGTKTIFSDDPKWAINMETESDTHTIEFTDWNRANYNACLTNIMVMLRYFDLNKGWIDSVESLSQSTSDPSSIQYGVIANSGSATIRDLDGEIEDYINDGIIPNSNVNTKLIVNGKQIQEHLTSDTKYDNITNTAILSFTNQIQKLENDSISISLNTSQLSLISILLTLLNTAGFTTGNIKFSSTQLFDKISHIFVPFCYFESSTLRQAIDKICQIAQINIFLTYDNKIKICDARPRYATTNKIIKIPSFLQSSSPNSELILKNKYDKIDIQYNKIAYDYEEFTSISYAHYEDPPFWDLYDSDTNIYYSYAVSKIFANYQDIHNKSNKDLTYIAFNIPAQNTNLWRYSCFKFSIPQDNKITANDQFKATVVANYLTGLLSAQERYIVKETDSVNIDKVFIKSSETEIINEFFNKDTSGNIISAKGGYNYALGIIAQKEIITCYVFKLDVILETNTEIATLFAYSGDIKIYRKNLISQEQHYNKGSGTNKFYLSTNELLNDKCYYLGDYKQPLYDFIANNILDDYKDGVKTCTCQIMCQDMYSTTGEKIKTWANGEILEVGDLVRVDKDNYGTSNYTYANGDSIIFRVTGTKFSYNGSPKLDLELQEVKQYT